MACVKLAPLYSKVIETTAQPGLTYPTSGGGERKIGVILRLPSLVRVSICLLGVCETEKKQTQDFRLPV